MSFHHRCLLRWLVLGLALGLLPCNVSLLAAEEQPARVDLYGDPLPDGALIRLGTTRWRPNREVYSLAVSPDGKTLAAGANWEISLWDLATGKKLRRFHERCCYNWSVAFAPDGKTLFSAGQDNALHRWNPTTGGDNPIAGHTRVIRHLALSADGKVLASGSAGGTIRVWDVANGKELLRVERTQQHWTAPLAVSPDGKLLAWCENRGVLVWQVAANKQLWSRERAAEALAFSPDGRVLAWGVGTAVECWDVAGEKRLSQLTGPQRAICYVAFSPDGKTLASASDGTVCLWDWAAGTERALLRGAGRLSTLAFTPDGRTVIAAGQEGRIFLWETATGKALHEAGHDTEVQDVGFFPDGQVAVTTSADRRVRFWDTATGKELHRFPLPPGAEPFSLSAAGRTVLAVARPGRSVRLLELSGATPARQRSVSGDDQGVPVALSPDGGTLATTWEHALVLQDRATGKEIYRLPGGGRGVRALAFSPDGKWLATGGANQIVRVRDAKTGKELAHHEFEGEPVNIPAFPRNTRAAMPIHTLAFAPDGKTLAVGAGNDVVLLDPATAKVLPRKASHHSTVSFLTFSPDGRLLASAARMEDSRFHVREVATMQEVVHPGPHDHQITRLAFSPDGRTVLSGSVDTSALLWDLTGRASAGKVGAATLSAREAEQLWQQLGDPEAARAWAAVWSLADDPRRSVPLLRDRLRPVASVPPAELTKWIADLESEQFSTREKATADLEKAGEAAEGALRKCMAGKPPLEARRRVERLLAKLEPSPESLRAYRALAVLEQAGTAEARRILEALAKGAPQARFTEDARASLARLRARTVP
jgi:WD40 repeat protein